MPDGRSDNFPFSSLSTCLHFQFQLHLPLELHMLAFSAKVLELFVWSILFTLGFKFCASPNFQQLDSLTKVCHLILGFCLPNCNQSLLWFCMLNGYSSILFSLIWTEPLDRFVHFDYFKLRWDLKSSRSESLWQSIVCQACISEAWLKHYFQTCSRSSRWC